ncbi:MAG: hypothetical protein JNJ61_05720 [Anaerolineae bacterium]|nr:hypothetical protein [Anaerolineae bacterium]
MSHITGNSMSSEPVGQNISALLMQAINDDSNLELDWLWYANQMTSSAERSYCLARALHINPDNRATQKELIVLRANRAEIRQTRRAYYRLSTPR